MAVPWNEPRGVVVDLKEVDELDGCDGVVVGRCVDEGGC